MTQADAEYAELRTFTTDELRQGQFGWRVVDTLIEDHQAPGEYDSATGRCKTETIKRAVIVAERRRDAVIEDLHAQVTTERQSRHAMEDQRKTAQDEAREAGERADAADVECKRLLAGRDAAKASLETARGDASGMRKDLRAATAKLTKIRRQLGDRQYAELIGEKP